MQIHKTFRISSSIFLLGLLILFCIGCAGGPEKNIERGQKQTKLADEFVIYAYSGPPVEEVNIERYREIADAGIDVLVPGNGTFTIEQNLKALDLAHEVGIRIIPLDTMFYPVTAETYKNPKTISKLIAAYKDHPAFAGYLLNDEPTASLFPALKTVCDMFRAKDSVHEPYINLFPSYASPNQLGVEDFHTYISDYIETVDPGVFSYDFYALLEKSTLFDAWYSDLMMVREATQKANIPFIVFVQSQGIRGILRVPNRAEILWQVNTALAYGARGFGWFTYWTPTPTQGLVQKVEEEMVITEPHYNAMIDSTGKRTEIYNYVREANLYLRKAGRGLIGWENKEVARYESGKLLGTGSSPFVTPIGDEANLVIGTFRKGDKLRIVISNSNFDKPSKFSLNLSQNWKWDRVFTSINAKQKDKKEPLREWYIDAGGSVLIDLKQL
ncbi:hypothetical protein ACS386_07715 [Flavobacteriaceae bacterium LMO-SS05]